MHAGVPIYPHRFEGERKTDEDKHWLITLAADATDAEAALILHEFNPIAQQTHPDMGQVPILAGYLTDAEVQALVSKFAGRIRWVEEDPMSKKIYDDAYLPEGTERRTYPWGITDINADMIRGRGVGVNVFVMDTGVRITHSQFGGRAFAGVDATSGVLEVCDPASTTCAADTNGHGTHCAGTVAGTTFGVADGASVYGMKVIADNGLGQFAWIIDTEQWVLSFGPRPAVVSESIGAQVNFNSHKLSIDALVADGVTVVVAAGNDNMDACLFDPAFIPSAITVASYTSSGDKSGFSNYGSCIDVWAPGSGILSSLHLSDSATGTMSGTSMACPHVSGLAAIMYEYYPTAASMPAAQRWDLLTASNRTGYVTGIPATALGTSTVNLVALAPTVAPAPLPAPTPVPTLPPAPDTGGAAVGDPHLRNVYGDRFDLMKPGKHLLINIPRGMTGEYALLRVQADASRLGGHCADMYFQEVNVTGSWAEAKRAGGYHYSVSQNEAETPEWTVFGKVELKVVHGHTALGLQYLNLYVKHLTRAGFAVGGLLGEDDHSSESIPSKECLRQMSLLGQTDGQTPSWSQL